jgi:hypothetical protein
VLTSAGITGLIQAIVLILGFLGYSNQATSVNGATQGIVAVAIAALTLGGNLLHALHAQALVTPVASPVAADGTPLVPAAPVAGVWSPVAAEVDAAISAAGVAPPEPAA